MSSAQPEGSALSRARGDNEHDMSEKLKYGISLPGMLILDPNCSLQIHSPHYNTASLEYLRIWKLKYGENERL